MEDFLGKTIRLAFAFATMGILLIVGDAVYFQATEDHLQFVIEFFSLLGLMFGAVTAKNATDNILSYKKEKVEFLANLPPNAPPQPEV